MSDMFHLKFKCEGCGEHDFAVRYRNKGENILAWMEGVVRPGLGEAHHRLSPHCRSEKCDLMMPVPEAAEGIGMKVLN